MTSQNGLLGFTSNLEVAEDTSDPQNGLLTKNPLPTEGPPQESQGGWEESTTGGIRNGK